MRVVVGAGLVAAAFRYGFSSFHHQGAAKLAHSSCWAGFHGRGAFWIARAAVKETEAPSSFYKLAFFAYGTSNPCFRALFFLGAFFDVFALRIIAAGYEFSETPFSLNQFSFFAFGADLSSFLRRLKRRSVKLPGSGTLRKTLAA